MLCISQSPWAPQKMNTLNFDRGTTLSARSSGNNLASL
jgi:hypothetical protein